MSELQRMQWKDLEGGEGWEMGENELSRDKDHVVTEDLEALVCHWWRCKESGRDGVSSRGSPWGSSPLA